MLKTFEIIDVEDGSIYGTIDSDGDNWNVHLLDSNAEEHGFWSLEQAKNFVQVFLGRTVRLPEIATSLPESEDQE